MIKRREPIELQLTAMIDIFSMIVIFLILGSVFGGADIVLPSGLTLPKSQSAEISAQAPTVSIHVPEGGEPQVRASMLQGDYPVEAFRSGAGPRFAEIQRQLSEFVGKMSEAEKKAGVVLNVAADRNTPYRDIYDTIKVFRGMGFDTLLFVATSEAGP